MYLVLAPSCSPVYQTHIAQPIIISTTAFTMSDKNICSHNASCCAPIWFVGWLFTIGFIQASFWKAVLAFLVWPYFLGSAIASLLSQTT